MERTETNTLPPCCPKCGQWTDGTITWEVQTLRTTPDLCGRICILTSSRAIHMLTKALSLEHSPVKKIYI